MLIMYITIIEGVVGVHGYIAEYGKKSAKKPTGHTITNIGYLSPGNMKKKHRLVTPTCFIDWFKLFKSDDAAIKYVIKRLNGYTGQVTVITNSRPLNNSAKRLINQKLIRIYGNTDPGINRARTSTRVADTAKRQYFIKLSHVMRYWSPRSNRSSVFKHTLDIYKSGSEDSGIHCVSNYRKKDSIGLRVGYVSYCAVVTSPNEDFRYVKMRLREMLGDLKVVCILHLNVIYSKYLLSIHQIYGDLVYYTEPTPKMRVLVVGGLEVCSVVKPVGISSHAMKYCTDSEDVLKDYYKHAQGRRVNVKYIEITSNLYTEDGSKSSIADKDKFKVVIPAKELPNISNKKKISITLIYGVDTPKVSVLRGASKESPTTSIHIAVYVMSGVILQTSCIVDYGDGVTMFAHCNTFSNKIPIRGIEQ